ncbi:MAG: hypothetical protein FDZ75_03660 [Actinobacteria bacterium]|nr:MAG: hypothetical protein FDZ75_03660 [Actinomycetota bacterium]
MAELNKAACEAMVEVGVNAATDVTGFGLLGHLHEMAKASGCAATVELGSVPLFERAYEFAEAKIAPGRTAEIVAWADEFALWCHAGERDVWMRVLCDPQTSGGLLIAVDAEDAHTLQVELEVHGARASRIGRFSSGEPGSVTVE